MSDLIHGAATDGDDDALGIIAIASNNTPGDWMVSTDNGQSWLSVASQGFCCGQTIAPDARIRFQPDPDWNGALTGSLVFKIWDQADGRATGDIADITTSSPANGPFSSQAGSISITVRPTNDKPSNSVRPFINGAPIPGLPLTAERGTWSDLTDSPNPTFTYTYQWQRTRNIEEPFTDIPGENTQTYIPAESDLGQFVHALVTAADDGVGEPPSMSATADWLPLRWWRAPKSSRKAISRWSAWTKITARMPSACRRSIPIHNLIPTWSIGEKPAHGTAAINDQGVVTYIPSPNYHGSDQFTVTAQVGTVVDTIAVNATVR